MLTAYACAPGGAPRSVPPAPVVWMEFASSVNAALVPATAAVKRADVLRVRKSGGAIPHDD